MLFALQLLLAQAAEDRPAAPPGQSFLQFAPILIMCVLGYIFLIRGPMKKQEKERLNMYAGLKKNDRVITRGGIIGIIASIEDKDEEVVLKVDESSNVRLRVLKSSIERNLSNEKAAKEQKEQKEVTA